MKYPLHVTWFVFVDVFGWRSTRWFYHGSTQCVKHWFYIHVSNFTDWYHCQCDVIRTTGKQPGITLHVFILTPPPTFVKYYVCQHLDIISYFLVIPRLVSKAKDFSHTSVYFYISMLCCQNVLCFNWAICFMCGCCLIYCPPKKKQSFIFSLALWRHLPHSYLQVTCLQQAHLHLLGHNQVSIRNINNPSIKTH